ncbi:MAG: cytochrome c oxidase assembly factor Coa1 family protein, partial [Planctomycetota bacterium]
ADQLSAPAYGDPKPQKGWFGRNWFWFLPTVILLPLCCCCGGPIGLMWYGMGQVFELPPYKDSVTLAEQNTEVQNALGTPITAPSGFMEFVTMMQSGGEFNVETSGGLMILDAKVPITGPSGTATLSIEAESSDGGLTWNYTLQEVELPDGSVIDLLPGGGGTTIDPDAKEADVPADSGREIPDQQ